MFKNLSVVTKIYLGFTVMSFLVGVISLIALVAVMAFGKSTKAVSETAFPLHESISSLSKLNLAYGKTILDLENSETLGLIVQMTCISSCLLTLKMPKLFLVL